jgi:hypothetical protein
MDLKLDSGKTIGTVEGVISNPILDSMETA